ncbi:MULTISPECIES: porin [Cupriavidus]|nr:porin [Cupriavidus pauculus]
MKTSSMVWTAGAACFILAGGAQAQARSGVTLYGSIDAGVTYLSNVGGHSLVKMDDSVSQGNRFGFRGTEKLTSDVSALFNLEGGFMSDTGASRQGGLLFGRQAYVGLSSERFGTVTMGRRFDQMVSLIRYHPGYYTGIYSFSPGDLDRISGAWLNNTVVYSSPSIGGLTVNAQYSFAEDGTSNTNGGRAYSLSAAYASGPFNAVLATTNIKQYAGKSAAALGLPSLFGTAANASQATTILDDYRAMGAGAAYTFDKLTISGLYTNTRLEPRVGSSETLHNASLTAAYYVTPSLVLTSGYTYSKLDSYRWNTFDGAVDYLFSKRTDVYFMANFQDAKSGIRALLATNASSSNDRQLALRIGIRHKF